MTTNGQQAPNSPDTNSVWILQGNPGKYDLATSLRVESSEFWNLRQHAHQVKEGDRVLIWLSGANAGIYAVGTVIGPTIKMPDSSQGQAYWTEPAEGEKPYPRAEIRYDQILEKPLLKPFVQSDPSLVNLSILTRPWSGTVFSVTPDERIALEAWIGPF